MAGHSKWANIQHRKGRQDAKKGKIATRLIKEIAVAARMGGSSLDGNPRLRLAVDKAYDNNMTKETVERAIKRGAGEVDGANYEEIRYEGYGINGAAVIVDCLTDNRVRTVAEVRHAFSKYGGNLGTELVSKATPDGYTLVHVSSSYGANPSLYKLSFDPVAGFELGLAYFYGMFSDRTQSEGLSLLQQASDCAR